MSGLVHHIDLNVSDLAASRRVYALVLGFLGYTCVRDDEAACEWDLRSGAVFSSVGIKQCHANVIHHRHERYAPGLHHLAWEAASRADVDGLHDLLVSEGVTVLDAPALFPEYSPDYYAVFFEDPDGIKLEVVHAPAFSSR